MNKRGIMDHIVKSTGLTLRQSSDVVETTINAIKGTLKKGRKVTLVGFGTFSVVKRKARNGRNPKTGETIRIPAANTPRFTPGKAFKDIIK
jgi:nucleoid DNA-binding protein